MSPTVREPVGRSLSHTQATTAPNSGTVAFRMDDRPVEMDSSAYEKHTNGMAEFKHADKGSELPVGFKRRAMATGQCQWQQKQCSNAHAQAGGGKRAQLGHANAHEQERSPPDGSEQDEFGQPSGQRRSGFQNKFPEVGR